MVMRALFHAPDYMVQSTRPPALVPSPRVIYRTKRQNLAHEARVERVNTTSNLELWHEFSRQFVESSPRLAPELSGYLHNRGFLPSRAMLYDLPNEQIDSYVSDFQRQLLPLVNGRNQYLLHNRQLFWQVARTVLPLLDEIAVVSHGRLIKVAEDCDSLLAGEKAGLGLIKPLHTDDSRTLIMDFAAKEVRDKAGHIERYDNAADYLQRFAKGHQGCLLTSLPTSVGEGSVLGILKVVFALDPKTNQYFACAGTQNYGCNSNLLEDTVSFGIAGATGEILPPKRILDTSVTRMSDDVLPEGMQVNGLFPGWWQLVTDINASLIKMPALGWVQLDLLMLNDSYCVIDAKSLVDAADFQAHQPILAGEQAERFIREFGV